MVSESITFPKISEWGEQVLALGGSYRRLSGPPISVSISPEIINCAAISRTHRILGRGLCKCRSEWQPDGRRYPREGDMRGEALEKNFLQRMYSLLHIRGEETLNSGNVTLEGVRAARGADHGRLHCWILLCERFIPP